jgi:long-chain acyl-CoA synthetase
LFDTLTVLLPVATDRRLGLIVVRLARYAEVALAELDLSASQYRTLGYLASGPISASLLAERVALRRPSITAVVDTLVARGLVARESDPDDRRRVGHRLTDAGREVLEQADLVVAERLGRLLGQLDPKRARRAVEALEALEEPLDALRADSRRRTRGGA